MKTKVKTLEEMMKEKDWESLVETMLAGFQQLDEDLKAQEFKKNSMQSE